jgi:hypothetical protein
MSKLRIGIDFDNTLVTYDAVFRAALPALAKIDHDVGARKRDIRDFLRTLPDGELIWQRLQGHVYGSGISGANMFEGAGRFLGRCRKESCEVVIVSHKTEFGHHDPLRVNLRDGACVWTDSQDAGRNDEIDGSPINWWALSIELAAIGCRHRLRLIADLNTLPHSG